MTAGEDVALSAPSLRDLSAGVLCTKTQLQVGLPVIVEVESSLASRRAGANDVVFRMLC